MFLEGRERDHEEEHSSQATGSRQAAMRQQQASGTKARERWHKSRLRMGNTANK
jgi:hypothetical protein